jgi:hypothetical protein
VRSRGRERLQTARVGPSTQLKASPTCCAARFTHPSSAAISCFGNTFGHVPSLGARPRSGHGWRVAQRSDNHFLEPSKSTTRAIKSSRLRGV